MNLQYLIELFELELLSTTRYTKETPMADATGAAPNKPAGATKPAKPAPPPKDVAQYTTHAASIAELKELFINFAFDDAEAGHPLFILISGPPKVGKTHFASTMSEVMPTYLLDGEHKGAIVAKKFSHTGNLRYKKVNSFIELIAALRYILKTPSLPKGCIIIDSGSDLQIWAEEQYLIENGKDAVGLPYNWADVFSKCNSVIKDVKAAGFTLIMTTRMKEQYKKNVATGLTVPRIWDNALYLSDLMIEWQGEGKAMVKLNAINRQAEPVPMNAATIGELLKRLKEQKGIVEQPVAKAA